MISDRVIEALRAWVRNLLRIGTVVDVLDDRGAVRVQFKELSELRTYELSVLQAFTHRDKAYLLPDVGDVVFCAFLPHDPRRGMVLGCLYDAKNAVPASDRNKRRVQFEDGTVVEYDRTTHTLTINVQEGPVKITADQVEIDGGGSLERALTYPSALSDFTGKPIVPYSSTVKISK